MKPIYPLVLTDDEKPLKVLKHAADVIEVREVNGEETLQFTIPFSDRGLEVNNEALIRLDERDYRIRQITDVKGEDGFASTAIYAEAAFYDLAYSVEKTPQTFEETSALDAMYYAVDGTDWSVGEVDVTHLRTWECTEKNTLAILRTIQQLYGGDLVFDNKNKKVSLLYQSGQKSGVLFSYQKNMTSIERVTDTTGLVTRLYAYGEDGLSFASVNDGKAYVENFSYTDEVRVATLDLSSFKSPQQMLDYTTMRLAQYSKPRISYVMKALDLSVLSGFEHEQFNLGDEVLVWDQDLNLKVKTRVIRIERNVLEPWKTVLELSTKLRELGSSDARREREQEVKDKKNEERLKALETVQNQAQSDFKAWRDAQTGLTEIMAHGQGYYTTINKDVYGAITTFIHDRPLLVDSTYIMKRTATGEAWSNDGGQSWNSGRDGDGQMLVKVLSAIGINAEWINVGGEPLPGVVDEIKSNVVYKVDLISTRGNICTSDDWTSRLIARVYHGKTDITDEIDAARFKWTRTSTDPDKDTAWNVSHAGGQKEITISHEDAKVKSTFTCEILGG